MTLFNRKAAKCAMLALFSFLILSVQGMSTPPASFDSEADAKAYVADAFFTLMG